MAEIIVSIVPGDLVEHPPIPDVMHTSPDEILDVKTFASFGRPDLRRRLAEHSADFAVAFLARLLGGLF